LALTCINGRKPEATIATVTVATGARNALARHTEG